MFSVSFRQLFSFSYFLDTRLITENWVCPTHSVLHASKLEWLVWNIPTLTPPFSIPLNTVDKRLNHQHMKHTFCHGKRNSDVPSVFPNIRTLTPPYSISFGIVDKHAKQNIKHAFWQWKRRSVWCSSWFVGNCFCICSWQWNHHWKYGLSDTFCSTHIKVSIIRFKHSYGHPLCSITFGKINNINWTSAHSTCILTEERWSAVVGLFPVKVLIFFPWSHHWKYLLGNMPMFTPPFSII